MLLSLRQYHRSHTAPLIIRVVRLYTMLLMLLLVYLLYISSDLLGSLY